MPWSEKLKNLTREQAGDGAMLKNDKGDSGFYSSKGNGVRVFGVNDSAGFPIPSKEVIAEFSSIEAMIEAGWVID